LLLSPCIKAAQKLSSFFYCADRRNHLSGTPPAFYYNCCEAATIGKEKDTGVQNVPVSFSV